MDAGILDCPQRASDDPSKASSTPNDKKQSHLERLRVSELFRFFEPTHQANLSAQVGKPRIVTDTSLTAFAQLAAFKLNCQRCFISLIDDSKQYIVAEATRSVSLEAEHVYDGEDDRLSFGQTVLDFKTGVCPGTIACFSSLDNSLDLSTAYVKASRSYYVMNDMSQLDGYRNRSYVSGWPHMRYYAEVPIHSPSGYTIGTLCVVDNEARDGLDVKGLEILKEIANTVMDHLELCSSKIQGKRAERMIQALGQFVQGHDSVRDLWIERETARVPEPAVRHLTIQQRAEEEFGSPHRDPFQIMSAADTSHGKGSSQEETWGPHRPKLDELTLSSSVDSKEGTDRSASAQTISSFGTISSTTTLPPTISLGLHSAPESTGIEQQSQPEALSQRLDTLENILSRAANLIREALDFDGVVFFDPRPRRSQINTQPASSDSRRKSKDFVNSARNQSAYNSQSNSELLPFRMISCSLTGKHSSDTIHMHEILLDKLLGQFSNGGVLSFDGEGVIRALPLDILSINSNFSSQFETTSFGAKANDSIKTDIFALLDVLELKRVFPDVASLTIYPLWDTSQDKCVAYCMAWSSNPARIIRRQDVIYLASFSNSVLAQLARIETVAADQAKNAFISSISHELRSPLHGIMASMEILRESIPDDSHRNMISLIESCGSALLDTIDNVLAFSDANRQANKQNPDTLVRSPTGHEGSLVSAVDMERLVEDVMSVCLLGSQYSRTIDSTNISANSEQSSLDTHDPLYSNGLIVICDISPTCSYLFEIDRAVWKRILINILGNALKYTAEGFVIVKYEHRPTTPPESAESDTVWREVVLTVEDSGKGISQEYLAHHLFKPFHQENPLAPGTGLGLSIVSRLVRSIDGHINITSEENVGTEVKVTAKLKSKAMDPVQLHRTQNPFKGLTIGFYDLSPVPDMKDVPTGILSAASKAVLALRSMITKYALSWDLVPVTAISIDSAQVDVLVVEDFHYQLISPSQVKALKKPIIVLCISAVPNHGSTIPENVVFLTSPFGPRGFKRSLESCFKIHKAMKTSGGGFNAPSHGRSLSSQTNDIVTTHRPATITSTDKTDTTINTDRHPNTSILLVEDNPINLKLLVTRITKMGHDFFTSTNGAQAVDIYTTSKRPIALIFMDIQMPIMDGMEATRKIRQHEQAHSLPRSYIVALTALGSSKDRQLALDCGVDLFLTKPVSLKTLTDIVLAQTVQS